MANQQSLRERVEFLQRKLSNGTSSSFTGPGSGESVVAEALKSAIEATAVVSSSAPSSILWTVLKWAAVAVVAFGIVWMIRRMLQGKTGLLSRFSGAVPTEVTPEAAAAPVRGEGPAAAVAASPKKIRSIQDMIDFQMKKAQSSGEIRKRPKAVGCEAKVELVESDEEPLNNE
jgi:hypothetical protein